MKKHHMERAVFGTRTCPMLHFADFEPGSKHRHSFDLHGHAALRDSFCLYGSEILS